MLVVPVLFERRMLQGYWMLDAGSAGAAVMAIPNLNVLPCISSQSSPPALPASSIIEHRASSIEYPASCACIRCFDNTGPPSSNLLITHYSLLITCITHYAVKHCFVDFKCRCSNILGLCPYIKRDLTGPTLVCCVASALLPQFLGPAGARRPVLKEPETHSFFCLRDRKLR
jgi:hypothetical protein